MSLPPPALADGFLTRRATWEAYIYIYLMVTTNQKPTMDIQKIKSNPNITLKESMKQQRMDSRKKTRTEKNYENNQNTINKLQ